ncbi:hypothetical protein [Niabella hibiscisoli]|nr:hypothetical protein [Niabella hibiscisoli]MCH5714906.1 hypothetical protein [Niabella hibiscisoli]
MNNSYLGLVEQTFNFPQENIEVKKGDLIFNGIDYKRLVEKYGTPLKVSYLPKIGININKAKQYFANAMKNISMKANTFILIVPKARIFPLW